MSSSHAPLSELSFCDSSRLRGDAEFGVRRFLCLDFEVFVAAEEPFKKTSSLYFPVGHPPGFEMWNSVLASPVGAIVWVDSFTTCPSWYVQRAFSAAVGAAPTVAIDA